MKQIFYDWGGFNVKLFHMVNGIDGGPFYDKLMLLGTFLAERHNFPIYLLIFIGFGLASLARHRRSDFYPAYRGLWVNVVFVFVIGFLLDWAFLDWAKHYFHFPRPYMALTPDTMRTIGNPMAPNQQYLSFPSGHASFAALIAASLWPALRQPEKMLAFLFVIWVCMSRLALGVHFPMDLLTGAFTALLIVLMVRAGANRIPYLSSERVKEIPANR